MTMREWQTLKCYELSPPPHLPQIARPPTMLSLLLAPLPLSQPTKTTPSSTQTNTPVEQGSVTPNAAPTATAASAALPPACRIRRPASAARGWLHATMPRVPYTGERLLVFWGRWIVGGEVDCECLDEVSSSLGLVVVE